MGKRRMHPNAAMTHVDGIPTPKPVSVQINAPILSGRSTINNVPLPNIGAIFIHTAIHHYKQAHKLLDDVRIEKTGGRDEKILVNIDEEGMMDYWAACISSIIFSIAAVESELNSLIENIDISIALPQKCKPKIEELKLVIKTKNDLLYLQPEYKINILPDIINYVMDTKILENGKAAFQAIRPLINLRNMTLHAKNNDVRDPKQIKTWLWTRLFPKWDRNLERMVPKENPQKYLHDFFSEFYVSQQKGSNWLRDYIYNIDHQKNLVTSN